MATDPTQMRLTDDELEALDLIRREKKLESRTAATRYAIKVCVATLGKQKRKSTKSSVAT